MEPEAERLPGEARLHPSELAIATPLHAAVAAENRTMVHHILKRGFNSNARALITGSQALTAAQYAIIIGDIESYKILAAHARFNNNSLTPIFSVHTLHFAVAQLRVDLIEGIVVPLTSAPATVLRQSLLHIACLPQNKYALWGTGDKVRESVHDVRELKTNYRSSKVDTGFYDESGRLRCPTLAARPFYDDGAGNVEYKIPEAQALTWGELGATVPTEAQSCQQEVMCKYLVSELGPAALGEHNNTLLHYLASDNQGNAGIIAWMRELNGVDSASGRRLKTNGDTPHETYLKTAKKRFLAPSVTGKCPAPPSTDADPIIFYA